MLSDLELAKVNDLSAQPDSSDGLSRPADARGFDGRPAADASLLRPSRRAETNKQWDVRRASSPNVATLISPSFLYPTKHASVEALSALPHLFAVSPGLRRPAEPTMATVRGRTSLPDHTTKVRATLS